MSSILRKHIFLFFAFFIGVVAFASTDIDDPCLEGSRKSKKTYQKATEQLSKDPKRAYGMLIELTKDDPDFAPTFYVLAQINYDRASSPKINDYDYLRYIDLTEKYLKSVIEICPAYHDFAAYNFIGNIYFNFRKYKTALKYYKLFVDNSTQEDKNKKLIISRIEEIESFFEIAKHPVPFNPEKVEGVCTSDGEYLPLISPDGEYAFFTHKYYPEKEKGSFYEAEQNYIEEFTVSSRIPTNNKIKKFGNGNPMPSPFNDKGLNQGGVSISIDNMHIFITICKDSWDCDIYSSDYIDDNWTQLKDLGPNINTKDWESQPSISADGKTLYFASMRPGNIGYSSKNRTSDLYASELDANGKWSKAKNLGPTINTEKSEKSPFMHTDSQTLYFSSNGKVGFGSYDIYFSQLKDNGEWSAPKNIGNPINTRNADIGFVVSTSGKKGYFASNKIEKNGWDVYSFDLYKEARPKKVVFLKGQIKDEQGEGLEDATIEIKNTKTNKTTLGVIDKISGKYAVAITVDEEKKEEFLMVVKKEGYSFTSQYIIASAEEFEEPATIDFDVKPISVGKTVKLNDINFATASAEFSDRSKIVLNNFSSFLKENPSVKIAIQGHTDNEGKYSTNMKLSTKRAKAVFDFLVADGIKSDRMTSKGFGSNRPVATNKTAEGRAKNRRTEFVITSK